MKEILFRGKTTDGKWVYGNLIAVGKYCCILESEDDNQVSRYAYLDDETGTIDCQATPVIPETVGRLINDPCWICYRNQRFFEGDIVNIYGADAIMTLDEDDPLGVGIIIEENRITQDGCRVLLPNYNMKFKIVGNVHDNPELVGEKRADMYKYCFGFGNVGLDEMHLLKVSMRGGKMDVK